MRLGFTGTREEPTREQRLWLVDYLLENAPEEFHHGCCVGADEFAHRAAKQCDIKSRIQIVLHPPEDTKAEMRYDPWEYTDCVWYPRKPYMVRNHDIVDAVDTMVALPNGSAKVRSGTWSTVRYAMKVGKPVTICMPDGTINYNK